MFKDLEMGEYPALSIGSMVITTILIQGGQECRVRERHRMSEAEVKVVKSHEASKKQERSTAQILP